jgi:hypothetical protein
MKNSSDPEFNDAKPHSESTETEKGGEYADEEFDALLEEWFKPVAEEISEAIEKMLKEIN